MADVGLKKGTLGTLQMARGVAALAVASFHAQIGTGAFVEAVPAPVERILAQGSLGVDFFFVLSGFIILHSHYNDPETAVAARSYALKRLFRVYLPYFPITAILVCAYALLPSLSQGNRNWGWFTTLTLLPSAQQPALLVAWTLVYEIMFYLLFLVFFVGHRIFAATVLLWGSALGAIALGARLPDQLNSPAWSVLFSPININFILGMLCAVAYRTLSARHGVIAIVVGVLLLTTYFLLQTDHDNGHFLFGLGAALLILGISLNDTGYTGVVARMAIRLGDASYAIYLIHDPLISLTSRAEARAPLLDNWFGSLIASVMLSALAGYAYHCWIERPALVRAREFVAVGFWSWTTAARL